MNRREFLGFCITAGMTLGAGGLTSCLSPEVNLSSEEKNHLAGLAIADAHAHPYQLFGSGNQDGSTPDIDMMRQVSMVACSFSAVGDVVKYDGVSGMPYSNTFNQLRKVKELEQKGKVKLIRRVSDVALLTGRDGAPGAVMAIEGGDALDGKLENLENFYNYGVRMITLLHNHDNEIGFNQRARSDGPLTPFGVRVVERMNELGMIVDASHSRSRTLKGITEVSAAPLIDSHTSPLPPGYRSSRPTRLRTWPEMELVARTGGVVCTWPLAYSAGDTRRTSLRHWAEEIVTIKKHLGIDHVGLGTDGGGNLPQKVKGWKSILSLPGLIKAMGEVGLSQDDIAAYVGGNFLRVLNQCLS